MSAPRLPQDRRPSAQEMMASAVRLQGANMAQKATLDVMGGKLIMILQIMQREGIRDATAGPLKEIADILSLTRDQVAERRAVMSPVYPDVQIQAAINKAADEIAAILLPKADGE